MSIYRIYTLWSHWKQGDELGRRVSDNGGKVSAGLRDWAQLHKYNTDVCNRLAIAFEGKNIIVHAEAHQIEFEPGDDHATGLLETLAREGLITVEEFSSDDDWDDIPTVH